MTIQFTDKINPKWLTVVFICRDNLSQVRSEIPNLPADLELDPTDCEAGKDYRYMTADQRWLFTGVGERMEFTAEKLRREVDKAVKEANRMKAHHLQLVLLGFKDHTESRMMARALGEMPLLSNYQFLPHRTVDTDKLSNSLKEVYILTDISDMARRLAEAIKVAEATCEARNLVNEPPNVLTSLELAARAKKLCEAKGLKVEVLNKSQIESLKMGGLLAVNRGSHDEPTFTIIEHKPANPRNKKPVVLVGKGIVFDTGGLSLKPTAGSMDSMKSDMAGAAAVIGTLLAVADNSLPLHIVGLIPSTDNRPGYNAYTPNDVITMMDGSTVEVLNTDAEGRMILADALHFAKRYEPELVIDLATLTGAAVVAVGTHATALMGTADRATKKKLEDAGLRTYERLVELPLWEEYAEQLKSDIADQKNIGGRYAGSITAAKFLEHFAKGYPWIHLDIAGTAFLESAQKWQPKNATGMGVRLLYEFLSTHE